jgi:hypothetical protein
MPASTQALPGHSAALGDECEVPVALCWCYCGRAGRHSARPWRDNHCYVRMTSRDGNVDIVLVIGAIGGERGNRIRHLIEQGACQGSVIDVVVRQLGCDDPSGIGIHAKVSLSSGPPSPAALLFEQPFARPT